MEEDTSPSGYWNLVFSSPTPWEQSSLLFEIGAQGIEVISDSKFSCFFEGTRSAALSFSEKASNFGFALSSIEPIPQKNWVQECEAMQESVVSGLLTVRPVFDAERASQIDQDPQVILLIPGLGFGTGHHDTTRTILCFIQHSSISKTPPRHVLDLGTGSGVLAIGVAKLYGAKVDAIDIDEYAAANARENVAINRAEASIDVKTGDISSAEDEYDLILANIYAEVLVTLEEEFFSRLKPACHLILSGIMVNLWKEICQVYKVPRWEMLEYKEASGWVTVLLKRANRS